jgi:hypothetical protein
VHGASPGAHVNGLPSQSPITMREVAAGRVRLRMLIQVRSSRRGSPMNVDTRRVHRLRVALAWALQKIPCFPHAGIRHPQRGQHATDIVSSALRFSGIGKPVMIATSGNASVQRLRDSTARTAEDRGRTADGQHMARCYPSELFRLAWPEGRAPVRPAGSSY